MEEQTQQYTRRDSWRMVLFTLNHITGELAFGRRQIRTKEKQKQINSRFD